LPLVLDTSVVIALLSEDDPVHSNCVALVDELREGLVIPALTLVEIDYWLRKRGDTNTWGVLVGEIASGGYRLYSLDERELQRTAELELTYADLRLGVVDASVVVTCETLGETKLATLDRRHFAVVRPRHCDALTLLPA
jgi:predicted nucleic acid-binding protein